MHISTRTAVASDYEAMWALYEQTMKGHITAIWGWDDAWQIADFSKAFAASATSIVLLEQRFAGYVQVDHQEQDDYLRMIILAPHAQSLGIGKVLLKRILDESMASGRHLRLRVFRVNDAARRFYVREGWRIVSDDAVALYMSHESQLKPSTEQGICTEYDPLCEIVDEALAIDSAILEQLRVFRHADKFGTLPGIDTSAEKARLESVLNELLDCILDGVAAHPSKLWLLTEFQKALKRVEGEDTEAREHFGVEMETIMDIVGLESSDGLLAAYLGGI